MKPSKGKMQSSLLFISLCCATNNFAYANDNFDFSGFGRFVVGSADKEVSVAQKYGKSVEYLNESLFGVKLDYTYNEKLSSTAQMLYHSSDDRDSGIEWLYLTYKLNKNFDIKLGKMRTPFFSYSDILDVGYAYPWITPPETVYREYLFSSFNGAKASYNYADNNMAYFIEGYRGQFEDKIYVNGFGSHTKVDNFRGAVANVSIGNFSLRGSYHTGDITDGPVGATQIGFHYDNLEFFSRIEVMNINSEIFYYPSSTGYYATFGKNFSDTSIYYTYAKHVSDEIDLTVLMSLQGSQATQGISEDIPQLSTLYNKLPKDMISHTIEGRWDFANDIAIKAAISQVSYEDIISFDQVEENNQTSVVTINRFMKNL